MVCESDLYLPGVLEDRPDGFALKHPTGTVPIRDPNGRLDSTDVGEQRTVGFTVSYDSVSVVDEPVGVSAPDGSPQLIGTVTYQRVRFTDRTRGPFQRLSFGSGIWPGESAIIRDHGDIRAAPLSEVDTSRPDRIRIDATELCVREVLDGGQDPFGEPLTEFQIEFDPDGSAVRLTVPGVPAWTTSGWHHVEPENVLTTIGKRIRDFLEGKDTNTDGSVKFRLKITADSDTIKLDWHWVGHRLGCWPADGLTFDRMEFIRSWLRDAEIYEHWFDASLTDLRETVQDHSGLDPADGRRVLRDSDAFDRAELERLVASNSTQRRDAALALCRRGDRAAVSTLARTLHDETTPSSDEWVLIGSLDRLGGREAMAELVRYVRTTPESRRRKLAAAALDERARSELANAVFEYGKDRSKHVASRLRRRSRKQPETAIPDVGDADLGDSPLRLASVIAEGVETLGELDKNRYRRIARGHNSIWEIVDEEESPTGAKTIAAVLASVADSEVGERSREALLDVARTDGTVRIRALAASTLVSVHGDDVIDDLIHLLIKESDEYVRGRIAMAIYRADHGIAERADVDAIADLDEGSEARRSLLENSRYGKMPNLTAVREGLLSDDPSVWGVAAHSAPDFPENPPYEGLLDVLIRIDPKEGPNPPTSEYKDALDSLEKLVENRDAPLPPVEPVLDLLEEPYHARSVALTALIKLAKSADEGEFHGVDPGSVYKAVFRTQRSNPRMYLTEVAEIVIETYESFDPAYLDVIPSDTARRTILKYVSEAVGEAAVGLLRAYADSDDEKMVQRVLYQFRSRPEAMPVEGLNVDLAENNRALLLYKQAVARAVKNDNQQRAKAFIDHIGSLVESDRWHVRAKAVLVLWNIGAAVEEVWELIFDACSADPNAVVRRVAFAGLVNCQPETVEEVAVPVAIDDNAPRLVRDAAWRSISHHATHLSAAAVDQLDAPLSTYPSLLRPIVHETLAEAGARDPDATPAPDTGYPELPVPEADEFSNLAHPVEALDLLTEIICGENSTEQRIAALFRLSDCYHMADNIGATDVVDPMKETAADTSATMPVRETAAVALILVNHRRALDAIDAVAPPNLGTASSS